MSLEDVDWDKQAAGDDKIPQRFLANHENPDDHGAFKSRQAAWVGEKTDDAENFWPRSSRQQPQLRPLMAKLPLEEVQGPLAAAAVDAAPVGLGPADLAGA
ncbi:hypothetical protein VE02_10185 [Pseudogymnoascus sp. 03VT05]|nr:hypothetical protein VE02_10185 [Pseudogymnoascus sp. 03VT05]